MCRRETERQTIVGKFLIAFGINPLILDQREEPHKNHCTLVIKAEVNTVRIPTLLGAGCEETTVAFLRFTVVEKSMKTRGDENGKSTLL